MKGQFVWIPKCSPPCQVTAEARQCQLGYLHLGSVGTSMWGNQSYCFTCWRIGCNGSHDRRCFWCSWCWFYSRSVFSSWSRGDKSLIQLRKNTLNILLVLICMVNLSFNVIICGQFKNSASSGVNTSPFFFKLATAKSRSTELSGSAVKAASAWAINLVVDPRWPSLISPSSFWPRLLQTQWS